MNNGFFRYNYLDGKNTLDIHLINVKAIETYAHEYEPSSKASVVIQFMDGTRATIHDEDGLAFITKWSER